MGMGTMYGWSRVAISSYRSSVESAPRETVDGRMTSHSRCPMPKPDEIQHGVPRAVEPQIAVQPPVVESARADRAEVQLRREQTDVLRGVSGLEQHVAIPSRPVLL